MMPPTDPERLATLAEDPLLKKLLRAAEHDVASEAQLAVMRIGARRSVAPRMIRAGPKGMPSSRSRWR